MLFTWHGGEPLVRSRAFYEKALALQQKHAAGKQIENALQTNGTLLTDVGVVSWQSTVSWWVSPSTGRKRCTIATDSRGRDAERGGR